MEINYQNLEEVSYELEQVKQLMLLMDDIFDDFGNALFKLEREKDEAERIQLALGIAYELNRVYDRMNTLNSIELDKITKLMEEIRNTINNKNKEN